MRQTKGMLAILIILIAVININAVLASIGVPTSNLTFMSSNDGSQIYRNSNGWFKENVILNITSTDPDGIREILYVTGGGTTTYSFSGPTTTYTTNPNISIEGSTIINYYAIDMMGNQEPPNNETIKLDRTLPYIIASVSPPANLNGWLNINAIVNFTAVDSLSGVAEIKGNTTVVTEGIKDVCGNATDIAGNINLTCVNLKIDKNAPVTSASLSGTAGNNGWNTSDVSVSLNTNDSISGVSGRFYNLNNTGWIIYSSPIPISTEGSNSIQYNSSDYAGNIEETKTPMADVNGFAGYVWANISHLSNFGIVGNYPPASQPILSNGGGGGGGGGGGVSGENYYNIEIKEKYDFYIYKDKTTSFGFKNSSNPIVYVNITGNVNAGERSTSVEVLRKTSTLLNILAPDIVYKNVNIWVGTSGFATSKNIKEAVIGFKVSNSLLTDNSINAADIKLVKWDGSNWVQLDTMKTKADSTYTYYDAKTITFSNFAITGIKAALSEVPLEMASNESITSTPPAEISKPVTSEKAPAVNLVVIVVGILIVAIFIVLYIKYKKP